MSFPSPVRCLVPARALSRHAKAAPMAGLNEMPPHPSVAGALNALRSSFRAACARQARVGYAVVSLSGTSKVSTYFEVAGDV